MADEGPGRFSRAPWERDPRDRDEAGGRPAAGRAKPSGRDERISSSPFFDDSPGGPEAHFREQAARTERPPRPKRPDQTSGPQRVRRTPTAGAGPTTGGPTAAGPTPAGPTAAGTTRSAPPAGLDPVPRPSPTRSSRDTGSHRLRGHLGEPDSRAAQSQPRGWLVDDEVPIDPNEYFREVDGDRQRRPALGKIRWTLSLGKTVTAVLAATVVLVTGIVWATWKWTDDSFRQVAALDPGSSSVVDADKQAGAENFLLIGSDIRRSADAADEAADSVGDAEAGRSARSDTMLLVHISADRSRMVVLSFPRDLQIDRPACEKWDATTGTYTGQQDSGETGVKINTAYQIGGPKCATQVVQKISGIAVNHFLSIDFTGFSAMTDAVGGVQVCADRPLRDSFLGEVAAQPGPIDLTGRSALNFVRARHIEGDPTSDYGRIRRQQVFLAALARKALSEGVLGDATRLGTLVEALAANTFADNVSVDDLLELGQAVQGLEAGKVSFVSVPTTGTANEKGNEELRTEDAKALFRAVIDGAQPGGSGKPGEGDAARPTLVAPAEVKLQVLNGTGVGGLAGQVARKLGEVGFSVVKVDNAKQDAPQTVVRYSAASEAQARTLAAAVPSAKLELDPSMGGALELVLGSGFDGVVTAVQAGQPAPDGQPAGTPAGGSQQLSAADTACA